METFALLFVASLLSILHHMSVQKMNPKKAQGQKWSEAGPLTYLSSTTADEGGKEEKKK